MSDSTAIEWSDATWNFLVGCSKVSEGCRNCYAIPVVERINTFPQNKGRYDGLTTRLPVLNWTGKLALYGNLLEKPLDWKRPRQIFVNSMSDLFHEDVPDEWIARAFAVMVMAHEHTYQILTKRPERMARLLADPAFKDLVIATMDDVFDAIPGGAWAWPLPNVWLGTSVENQDVAHKRISHLVNTPAAVRFLSMEPLLGRVSILPWMTKFCDRDDGECAWLKDRYSCEGCMLKPEHQVIHWVIAGGESGHGARPMHPDWARDLRDQCVAAGVPFFFKQHGEWLGSDQKTADGLPIGRDARTHTWPYRKPPGPPHFGMDYSARVGKKAAGRLLDGVEWSQFPDTAKEAERACATRLDPAGRSDVAVQDGRGAPPQGPLGELRTS